MEHLLRPYGVVIDVKMLYLNEYLRYKKFFLWPRECLVVHSMVAITTGIVLEIVLMVRFAHEEFQALGRLNLCGDLSFDLAAGLHFVANLFGDLLLFARVREDDRAVLRASVVALPIQRRRIVHAEEEANEIRVRHLVRIVGHLQNFGMIGRAGAHGFVVRLRCTAHVADDGRDEIRSELLAKELLRSPEATGAEGGQFETGFACCCHRFWMRFVSGLCSRDEETH